MVKKVELTPLESYVLAMAKKGLRQVDILRLIPGTDFRTIKRSRMSQIFTKLEQAGLLPKAKN